MPSFKQRSGKKELLDMGGIPFEDIRRNMQELDVINQQLGGHAITIKGLRTILDQKLQITGHPVHIVEAGCGDGNNLRVIKKWAKTNNIPVVLSGIDNNEACISYAQSLEENNNISFIHSGYGDVVFAGTPDIIFSSLFCHHFTQQELQAMLQWMHSNSSAGFFINDLHRHPFAYYAIRMLTSLFSKSYLVKNDAPLSVLRGFIRRDWKELREKTGLELSIRWRWAFRWLVISIKNERNNRL